MLITIAKESNSTTFDVAEIIMLITIAKESNSTTEYARRAEAHNSTEAKPLPDKHLADIWLVECGAHCTSLDKAREHIVRAIRKARRERVRGQAALWGALVACINTGVES